MKIIALLTISHLSLVAAELRVTLPNDGRGLASVESMFDDAPIANPEKRISQEGQIAVLDFKNLKSGEYIVSYLSALDPLAYQKTIMTTRVTVSDSINSMVMLFEPWGEIAKFPKEVEDFIMKHRQNYIDFEAVYDGHKKSFEVSRGSFPGYSCLRFDCVYSIKVWDHSHRDFKKDRKVIFERTFRAVKPEHNF